MEVIIGAIVSFLVMLAKKYFKTESIYTYFLALVASIAAALVYWILQHTTLLDSLIQVLSGAGIFYTFILGAFKK